MPNVQKERSRPRKDKLHSKVTSLLLINLGLEPRRLTLRPEQPLPLLRGSAQTRSCPCPLPPACQDSGASSGPQGEELLLTPHLVCVTLGKSPALFYLLLKDKKMDKKSAATEPRSSKPLTYNLHALVEARKLTFTEYLLRTRSCYVLKIRLEMRDHYSQFTDEETKA